MGFDLQSHYGWGMCFQCGDLRLFVTRHTYAEDSNHQYECWRCMACSYTVLKEDSTRSILTLKRSNEKVAEAIAKVVTYPKLLRCAECTDIAPCDACKALTRDTYKANLAARTTMLTELLQKMGVVCLFDGQGEKSYAHIQREVHRSNLARQKQSTDQSRGDSQGGQGSSGVPEGSA